MRFFQRVFCLLRLNKTFAFFSAGALLAATERFICVSFSGSFACCASVKNICVLFSGYFACCGQNKFHAFLSAVALPAAAQKNNSCVLFSGYFACCGQNKSFMRFFQRVLCLLRLNKIIVACFSAGILPAADKIKVLCVSFSGCFACCGSIKK